MERRKKGVNDKEGQLYRESFIEREKLSCWPPTLSKYRTGLDNLVGLMQGKVSFNHSRVKYSLLATELSTKILFPNFSSFVLLYFI